MVPIGIADHSSSSSILPGGSSSEKKSEPQIQHAGEYDNILSSPSEVLENTHIDVSTMIKVQQHQNYLQQCQH